MNSVTYISHFNLKKISLSKRLCEMHIYKETKLAREKDLKLHY